MTAYEPVIGLEVHAELQTASKMFCACPVVDLTLAQPNTAVCPVCSGMPGTLPTLNARAVEYAVRVALALGCQVNRTSIFARKNYFYPDLPKGYQISQYEQPLAVNGALAIPTAAGDKVIRVRRVHLEEDTGKLTHLSKEGRPYSLVDLNRAGVPLLEIVTEPDFRSAEEVRLYAAALRSILRYLGVNSGELQKGVLRVEPNVSVHRPGAPLGVKVEIKNLNSFRAIERAVAFEIHRQVELLERGQPVRQETVGWDEQREVTFTQRVKEGDTDYRYFPEPDLPPLVLPDGWVDEIRRSLPELPAARLVRFQVQYGLSSYDAGVLTADQAAAGYYEAVVAAGTPPRPAAAWVTGDLFGLIHPSGLTIDSQPVTPSMLSELVQMEARGEISRASARVILGEMFRSGRPPAEVAAERGLLISTAPAELARIVTEVIAAHPDQVAAYRDGKEALFHWLLGQVMKRAAGKAGPHQARQELARQLQRSSPQTH